MISIDGAFPATAILFEHVVTLWFGMTTISKQLPFFAARPAETHSFQRLSLYLSPPLVHFDTVGFAVIFDSLPVVEPVLHQAVEHPVLLDDNNVARVRLELERAGQPVRCNRQARCSSRRSGVLPVVESLGKGWRGFTNARRTYSVNESQHIYICFVLWRRSRRANVNVGEGPSGNQTRCLFAANLDCGCVNCTWSTRHN